MEDHISFVSVLPLRKSHLLPPNIMHRHNILQKRASKKCTTSTSQHIFHVVPSVSLYLLHLPIRPRPLHPTQTPTRILTPHRRTIQTHHRLRQYKILSPHTKPLPSNTHMERLFRRLGIAFRDVDFEVVEVYGGRVEQFTVGVCDVGGRVDADGSAVEEGGVVEAGSGVGVAVVREGGDGDGVVGDFGDGAGGVLGRGGLVMGPWLWLRRWYVLTMSMGVWTNLPCTSTGGKHSPNAMYDSLS